MLEHASIPASAPHYPQEPRAVRTPSRGCVPALAPFPVTIVRQTPGLLVVGSSLEETQSLQCACSRLLVHALTSAMVVQQADLAVQQPTSCMQGSSCRVLSARVSAAVSLMCGLARNRMSTSPVLAAQGAACADSWRDDAPRRAAVDSAWRGQQLWQVSGESGSETAHLLSLGWPHVMQQVLVSRHWQLLGMISAVHMGGASLVSGILHVGWKRCRLPFSCPPSQRRPPSQYLLRH